jgi:hypothetical protein
MYEYGYLIECGFRGRLNIIVTLLPHLTVYTHEKLLPHNAAVQTTHPFDLFDEF